METKPNEGTGCRSVILSTQPNFFTSSFRKASHVCHQLEMRGIRINLLRVNIVFDYFILEETAGDDYFTHEEDGTWAI